MQYWVPIRVGNKIFDVAEVVEYNPNTDVYETKWYHHGFYFSGDEIGEIFGGSRIDALNHFDEDSHWTEGRLTGRA